MLDFWQNTEHVKYNQSRKIKQAKGLGIAKKCCSAKKHEKI